MKSNRRVCMRREYAFGLFANRLPACRSLNSIFWIEANLSGSRSVALGPFLLQTVLFLGIGGLFNPQLLLAQCIIFVFIAYMT